MTSKEKEGVQEFNDGCVRAVKIITDAHMIEINRLCAEILELRKVKTAGIDALDFLERRFGNNRGTDWGDEDAAHVADQLSIALGNEGGR